MFFDEVIVLSRKFVLLQTVFLAIKLFFLITETLIFTEYSNKYV